MQLKRSLYYMRVGYRYYRWIPIALEFQKNIFLIHQEIFMNRYVLIVWINTTTNSSSPTSFSLIIHLQPYFVHAKTYLFDDRIYLVLITYEWMSLINNQVSQEKTDHSFSIPPTGSRLSSPFKQKQNG